MKMIAITLFTILLSTNLSNSSLVNELEYLLDGIDGSYQNSTCIVKFAMEILKGNEIYVFKNKSNYNDLSQEMAIKTLQHDNDKKIMIIETTTATPRCEKLDNTQRKRYLMFVNSAEDLEMMLNKLLCIGHYSRSRIVVVKTNEPIQSLIGAEAYLKVISKHGIDRAEVLTTREPGVINYWRAKQKCKIMLELTHVYYCDVDQMQTTPYPDINVLSCPVTVGVRELVPYAFVTRIKHSRIPTGLVLGIEIRLIEMIFKNITYVIGTYDELMKKLLVQKVTFIVGALPTPKEINIAAAHPHDHAKMIAIVKRRSNQSVLSIFKTLSINIWITFFFAQLVVVIIMYVIVQCFNEKLTLATIVFYFFTITIGKPLEIDRLTYLRLVFIYWSWLAFFVRSAFEAFMVYSAIDNENEYQINYLDDLCSGSRQAYTFPEYKTYFDHGLTLSKCSIPKENFHYVETPLDILAESREADSDVLVVFLLDRHYRCLVAIHRTIDYQTLHVLKEYVFLCPLSFHYHQGLLMSVVLPIVMLRLQDMGLISLTMDQLQFYVDLAFYKRNDAPTGERYVMSMRQIQLVLMLYLWGALVAIVVFIAEVVVFKLKIDT